MPNVVDAKLRDRPLESTEPGLLLRFINYEILPVLKRALSFVNRSWAQNVDITEDRLVEAGDEYLRVDASAGPVTITLRPSLEGVLGVRILTVKKVDDSDNPIVISTLGDDDVDGVSTVFITTLNGVARLRPREDGYDVISGSVSGAVSVPDHEPYMTKEFSTSVLVPTNRTMLAHDPVLLGDAEIVVEGTGEVLAI